MSIEHEIQYAVATALESATLGKVGRFRVMLTGEGHAVKGVQLWTLERDSNYHLLTLPFNADAPLAIVILSVAESEELVVLSYLLDYFCGVHVRSTTSCAVHVSYRGERYTIPFDEWTLIPRRTESEPYSPF